MSLLKRNLVVSAVALCLFCNCGIFNEMLPAPVDVPKGPAGVEVSGVREPYVTGGEISEEAPMISEISKTTFPDETLVITGDRLDNAFLKIWSGDTLYDIEPLRTANDRMLAVVPKHLPISTMLVWPVVLREDNVVTGTPIRVNGATAWWAWPARVRFGRKDAAICIIGRNLTLEGSEPGVYLTGKNGGQWLNILSSNPYNIEAALPPDLHVGEYKVWAHNGTGGKWGWSESVSFKVAELPTMKGLPTINITDFGAVPDDGIDDIDAIQAAIDHVVSKDSGSATITFTPGVYHISKPIFIPDISPKVIHLSGAGMGTYDFKTNSLSKTYTSITFLPEKKLPPEMIDFRSTGGTVRNLNVIMGSDGNALKGVSVRAADVKVENIRVVVVDKRPENPETEPFQHESALYIVFPGKANIEVLNCEFYFPAHGIQIGDEGPTHFSTETGPFASTTDYVRIANCIFRGTYSGPRIIEEHPRPGRTGAHSRGICVYMAKKTILEHCDFAGADRTNGLILGRVVRCGNTCIRHQYYSHNTAHDVGPHNSVKGMNPHMGELFLFHNNYPHGGMFDVVEANAQSVTIREVNLGNAGRNTLNVNSPENSQIINDVGHNENWIVYICAGKGVGQYREVTDMSRISERAAFTLLKPWRVIPDNTSRIFLGVAFRENILFKNVIDGGEKCEYYKTNGVLFWYNAIDNIVADNEFRNLNWGGVVFDTIFRNPCCWNLTRDNLFTDIRGFGQPDSRVYHRGFFCNYYQLFDTGWPAPEDRVWYGVGNIARSNRGNRGVSSASVNMLTYGTPKGHVSHKDMGMIMSVIENNIFEHVDRGIELSPPACWVVIRNNRFIMNDNDIPEILIENENLMDTPLIIKGK